MSHELTASEIQIKDDPAMIGIGGAPTRNTTIPKDDAARKAHPIASGFLDYFPDAVSMVAHLSFMANEKHNPGQPLHWSRDKSMDEPDMLERHFVSRGTFDNDGFLHDVKVAWRAMASLQKEIERRMKAGLPICKTKFYPKTQTIGPTDDPVLNATIAADEKKFIATHPDVPVVDISNLNDDAA